MAERFDEILDDCISRIVLQGNTVDDCLRRYPEFAVELEAALRVVSATRDTYAPRPGAKDRAREALLAAMAPEVVIETPVVTRTNGHRRSWVPWGSGHQNGFEQVLDDCVTAIVLRGESVRECLDRHPAYATQLAPHLWIVERFQQAYTFTPHVEAKVRARAALHRAMNDEVRTPSPVWTWLSSCFSPTPMRWAGSLAAVVLATMVTAGGTAYASQDALPGDPLYAVKAAVEGLRVTLALTEEGKAAVLVELTETRVKEIQKGADQGRPEVVVQASERLERQATRATDNLEQAAANGKDVAPLNKALTQQLDHAKQTAEAALPDAPPAMKAALAQAAATADKKQGDRKERTSRPQDRNRGGANGSNSGSSNPGSAGAPPDGPGSGVAVVPSTGTPKPTERSERPEPPRATPTDSPMEESSNERPTPRPAEPRRAEPDEREARPQAAPTRVVEGVVLSINAGEISVNGQTIIVPLGVRIEGGGLSVGVTVRIEGTLQPDGHVLATNIRIIRSERRNADAGGRDERRSSPPAADRNQRPAGRDDGKRATDRTEPSPSPTAERERPRTATPSAPATGSPAPRPTAVPDRGRTAPQTERDRPSNDDKDERSKR